MSLGSGLYLLTPSPYELMAICRTFRGDRRLAGALLLSAMELLLLPLVAGLVGEDVWDAEALCAGVVDDELPGAGALGAG